MSNKGVHRFAGLGLESVQAAGTGSAETRLGESDSTAVVVEAAPTSIPEESPAAVAPGADAAPTSVVEDPATDVATAAAPTTNAENSEVGELAAAAAGNAAPVVSGEEISEDLEGNVALAETAEAVDAVECDAAAIEQGECDATIMSDAAVGLEAICKTLEVSLETGGMDNSTAEMLHHAVNAHARQLCVEQPPVASLECFSGNSKMRATSISLESLRDWISKIWKAVKEGLVKLRRMISDFFMKLRTSAPTVEKAAVVLKARAMKLDEKSEPKHPKFVAKTRYITSEEGKSLDKVTGKLLSGLDAADEWVGTQKTLATDLAKSLGKLDVKSNESLEKSSEDLKSLDLPSSAQNRVIDLGGDRSMVFPTSADAGLVGKAATLRDRLGVLSSLKATFSDSRTDAATDIDIEPLSKAQMIAICDDVIRIAQRISKGSTIVETRDELVKAGDDLEKKVVGEDISPDNIGVLSAALKLSSSVSENIGKPVDRVYLHAMQVSRDLLNIVKQNLDSH